MKRVYKWEDLSRIPRYLYYTDCNDDVNDCETCPIFFKCFTGTPLNRKDLNIMHEASRHPILYEWHIVMSDGY